MALHRFSSPILSLFVAVSLLYPTGLLAAPTDSPIVREYREHRESFKTEYDSVNSRQITTKRGLLDSITELRRRREVATTEQDSIEREIVKLSTPESSVESRAYQFATIFIPESIALYALVSFSPKYLFSDFLYGVIVPLWLVGLILLLTFKDRKSSRRFVITVTLMALAFLLFIVGVAQAETSDNLVDKLQTAHQILSSSDHRRYITILQKQTDNAFIIPKLEGSEHLPSLFTEFDQGTPEYYYTLASLNSHEKRDAEAIDAIRQMISSSLDNQNRSIDAILVHTVSYLVHHQHARLANDLIAKLLGNLTNTDQLLGLASFLYDNQMASSSELVLNKAIELSSTTSQLLALASFFRKSGESGRENETLDRALAAANSVDSLQSVTSHILKNRHANLVKSAISKLFSMSPDTNSFFAFADLFLSNNNREDAAIVISELIKRITFRYPNFTELLLVAADQALKRNLPEQAIEAMEKLSVYLGDKRYSLQISPPRELLSSNKLPLESKITAPLYYGILTQGLKLNSKAEAAYASSVDYSLSTILSSHGSEIPSSLNEYYLLGQLWLQQQDITKLQALDRVFTSLEVHFINSLEKQLSKEILDLQTIERHETVATNAAETTLVESQTTLKEIQRKKARNVAREVAVYVFGFMLLAICLIRSEKLDAHQGPKFLTYRVISSAFEVFGFARMASFIGIFSGSLIVFLAQALQIFQLIHEELRTSLSRTRCCQQTHGSSNQEGPNDQEI